MLTMKNVIRLLMIFCISLVTGCACVDPFEPLNRKIFAFNTVIDHAIFRPVARAYDKIVPPVIACHIGNFFDNLDEIPNIANNLLQFRLLDAWSDCWRFAFNTTFGIGGLFDVATCAGLPKHHQDFGLTLARYGFVNSPYLMIPFFGPSTIRDAIGWTVDWNYLSIWPYIEPRSLRYGLYGLRLIHKRACLLSADPLIDEALDPYLFLRDAYLQKRECDIKSICPPPAEGSTPSPTPGKATEDTYVEEEGSSHTPTQNDQDTFVPESEDKNPKGGNKVPTKATADNSDPFVP